MEDTPYTSNSKGLLAALVVSFWLIVGIFMLLFFGSQHNLLNTLFRTAVNLLLLILLFYGNISLINTFLLKRKFLSYLIIALPFCTLIIYGRMKLQPFFPNSYSQTMLQKAMQETTFNLLISMAFFALSILYQIFTIQVEAEKKTLEAINEFNKAKIQFLKAQINPHFLFNALNNIYSLAVVKSEDTPEMILKLSGLLRYVIYSSEGQKVALEQEIKHIFKFIYIFQMRDTEDLDIRFNVEGRLSQIEVEPMILIPLVENCFKHCDFSTNEQAYIELNLIVKEKKLIFKTDNSKNNLNIQKDKMGGVGLANIKKRLEVSYPQRHQLKFTNYKNRFEVYLELGLSDDRA